MVRGRGNATGRGLRKRRVVERELIGWHSERGSWSTCGAATLSFLRCACAGALAAQPFSNALSAWHRVAGTWRGVASTQERIRASASRPAIPRSACASRVGIPGTCDSHCHHHWAAQEWVQRQGRSGALTPFASLEAGVGDQRVWGGGCPGTSWRG